MPKAVIGLWTGENGVLEGEVHCPGCPSEQEYCISSIVNKNVCEHWGELETVDWLTVVKCGLDSEGLCDVE